MDVRALIDAARAATLVFVQVAHTGASTAKFKIADTVKVRKAMRHSCAALRCRIGPRKCGRILPAPARCTNRCISFGKRL
jgi:hypothetical protein